MENKVEKALCRPLLACHLKVAFLKSLEVVHAVLGQEVKTVLNAFDFFNDKLDDLQRIALLVDLLDDGWLLDKNGMDELD